MMQDAKHDNASLSRPTGEHSQPLDQQPPMYPQQSYLGQQPQQQQQPQQPYPPQPSQQQQQQPYPPQPYPQQQSNAYIQQQISVGEAYRANLFAQCAQGNHTPKTNYGIAGIITAILCFPCGLICLFMDVQRKCERCGVAM